MTLMLLIFAQAICTCASASAPPKLIQETLQTEVMLRHWNAKSFGERKPHKTISVIAAEGNHGDIVILRWNLEGTGFVAEIYRQQENPWPLLSWEYREAEHAKTINLQPNGEFYMSELVEGVDGGQRVEVFRLRRN